MRVCTYPSGSRSFIAFALLFFLIFPIYSNAFHASWQFDDKPNIVKKKRIHIDNLRPESLWDTFFLHPHHQEKLYRPIPCLTFALNWYFGQDNPFGYHVVNILIHALNAFLLFLTTCCLFKTPALKGKYSSGDEYFIALLSAALWAINPIQTQAVTYIVQRMASMAAMFYILGMYFYIKGRLSEVSWKQLLLFFGCLLCYACAMGSKENAVMLPVSLLLVEFVFFDHPGQLQVKKRKILALLTGLMAILLLWGFLELSNWKPHQFLFQPLASRPFSRFERLLTESRIVIYYLSQIFYPIPARLSIEHDVVLSISFFKPWTTLPAILSILCLIGVGFSQIRRRPLIALAILFFFLNHIVESTIIALELIFEHRNYLPSFFLFLPVAAGFRRLLDFYAEKNRYMQGLIFSFGIFLLVNLGGATYIRNMAWATVNTLWKDAMIKAPNSARPLNNLAINLAWGDNVTPLRYEVALALFKKALPLSKARNFFEPDILGNIASIHYHNNDYSTAVKLHKQALRLDPEFLKLRYKLIKPLILLGEFDEASEHADLLLSNSRGFIHADYLNIKGFILLWQNRPAEALDYLRKALAMAPNRGDILLNTGMSLSLMGNHKNGEWFLKRAAKNSPRDLTPLFCLIENSIRAGEILKASDYAEKLLSTFSVKSIMTHLKYREGNFRSVPVSKELVAPIIKNTLMKLSEDVVP